MKYLLVLQRDNGATVASYESHAPGGTVYLNEDVVADRYTFIVSTNETIQPGPPVEYVLDVTYPDPVEGEEPQDTTEPSVSITQPSAGSTIEGNFTVSGSADDDNEITQIDYRFDGGSWQTAQGTDSWSGQLDSTTVANGEAVIEARATDVAGNVGTGSISVTVQNSDDSEDPGDTTTGYMWLSPDEIAALPTSGEAWENLRTAATGSLGSVGLDDNNSKHDTNVLALAYYAVRTNNDSEASRVAQEISTVPSSDRARALEFCRNITSYIIAADVINLQSVNADIDSEFRSFIRQWVIEDASLQGHSGGDGIKGTAARSANNWGTMCRAAYAAAAVYLGDSGAQNNAANWHKGWLGDNDTYSGMKYNDTTWHADPNNKRGINAKGATIEGHNVDGVLPEDQRRGTYDFGWPASQENYVWEGLQGALVADIILQRAGKVSATYEDSAMKRAYTWLYEVNNYPAEGDDRWQIWVANKVYGTNYPTDTGVSPGKNMGWTDWTHQ